MEGQQVAAFFDAPFQPVIGAEVVFQAWRDTPERRYRITHIEFVQSRDQLASADFDTVAHVEIAA